MHGLGLADDDPVQVFFQMCIRDRFNGNARHDSHNDDALRFARENGLLFFSGSDHHETEDRGRGGMVLPREPKDEADLVRLLPSAGLLPDILLEFFPVKPEK